MEFGRRTAENRHESQVQAGNLETPMKIVKQILEKLGYVSQFLGCQQVYLAPAAALAASALLGGAMAAA